MEMPLRFTGNYNLAFFFGVLTVISWAITYIFILIAGYKSRVSKKVSMPYVAGTLNFAWEICAMYFWDFDGRWAYVIWFLIDLFIVYLGFIFLNSTKTRCIYISGILLSIVAFFFIFQMKSGFVYSVYTIDLIMEIWFLIDRKKLSSEYKIQIAISKLLGDFFAAFVFGYDYIFVVITALLVFFCNFCYLNFCIKEKTNRIVAFSDISK